jgi:hypothetical protein
LALLCVPSMLCLICIILLKCVTSFGSWLKHCATSLKVGRLISDGLTDWNNDFGRHNALRSTQHCCNCSDSSRSVQWLLYLFVRIEDVTDLIHAVKEMSHMRSMEEFYFCKCATNNNRFCKKIEVEFNRSSWIIFTI